jgi:uncharacterized SAM-binding protein YcdF (DUF218 family)
LKSLISPLFEPLGAIWFLLVIVLLRVLWKRHWQAALWLSVPILLVFLFGSTQLPERLIERAERPYAAQDGTMGFVAGKLQSPGNAEPSDAVVILGGGTYVSENDPYQFGISGAGSRLTAGIELARQGRVRFLVLGGSMPVAGRPGFVSMSGLVDWIQAWQLVHVPVAHLGICADTHDEAIQCRKLYESNHWKKVILVTSALHMPRAVAVFKSQGINVVPVACDFQGYGVPEPAGWWSPFPKQHQFHLLNLYLHEKVGYLAYTLRGWI